MKEMVKQKTVSHVARSSGCTSQKLALALGGGREAGQHQHSSGNQVTKPSAPAIDPFSHEQWVNLLGVCETACNWKIREEAKTDRSTFERDRAILFTLLDTGTRANQPAVSHGLCRPQPALHLLGPGDNECILTKIMFSAIL
ncbi:MAG TPA: hypothetical protein VFY83_00750 [Anaerolineales bacterium]|nr:hypothetical protein [Anaerolineales bacterium]